eukprot:scaffold5682_cov140-Cylindrotheca_fusiformis.AAC.7
MTRVFVMHTGLPFRRKSGHGFRNHDCIVCTRRTTTALGYKRKPAGLNAWNQPFRNISTGTHRNLQEPKTKIGLGLKRDHLLLFPKPFTIV